MFGLGLPLDLAVTAPRIHIERDFLSIEKGYPPPAVDLLESEWLQNRQWPDLNMFFGGVHAVEQLAGGEFRGMGDPRRGGAVAENS